MATITKHVDRGVPAGKRYQYFGSGERNDDGDYISAGDIFMIEDSLGKPARYVYIETDASCDVAIRLNSQYIIYPLRAARVNEPRHPDLENPITMTDTSMEAFPVGTNEVMELAGVEVSDIYIDTWGAGSFEIFVM